MAAHWLSDLEMDDPCFFQQWQVDPLDQLTEQQIAAAFSQDLHQSISLDGHTSLHSYVATPERPKKTLKSSSWDSCITEQSTAPAPDASSSPTILSFGNPEAPKMESTLYGGMLGAVKPEEEVEISFPRGTKRSYGAMISEGARKPVAASQNQEHIMTERRRREKLSQRFIALSKIVPGLKQLQEKVMALEDQAMKRTVESAVLVKKSPFSPDDGRSSCDDDLDGLRSGGALLEIEVKMSERTILIKIHCESRKGVAVKALSEIEKLGLAIINASVVPFPCSSSVDITAMAQVEEEFSMTVKDIVKKLNSAFKQFM